MESFELIQQKTKCNYCRNLMIMSEPISDANFIEVKGKVMNNGDQAYALYCSGCLAFEERTKDPRMAIDKETLQEFNVESLKDASSSTDNATAKAKAELETENH
mgnify:CR=1 FL=1